MNFTMIGKIDASKLLVMLLILWVNLDFSIGEDFVPDYLLQLTYDDDASGMNQTEIDWLWESILVLRWDIDNRPKVWYNDLQFDIDFSVSDYIQAEDHVRYTIYQNAKCGDPDDIITDSDGYIDSWITDDNTPKGVGLDKQTRRTIRLSSQLNADTISQSKSYEETIDGSGSDASIKFCIRFSLWSNGPSDEYAEELNHITVAVGLLLDLSDESFSISGQNIEALEEGVQTSEDQFFLESFLCDTDGNRRQDTTPLSQGVVARICVQPTQQASEVGFRMKSIDTFSFSQGVTSQAAILNGKAAANLLTDFECEVGAEQCVIETLLFAHFYQQEQVNIVGSGEATLQWGGMGVTRRMQVNFDSLLEEIDDDVYNDMESERSLQDRPSTKTMQLSQFSVLRDKQGRPPLRNNTGRIILISMLVVSIALVVPIVYYFVWKPKQESPALELDLASAENDCVIVGIPDEETIYSRVAGDRSTASHKSSRSSRSRIQDDRTITSVKSSRSNRSRGSRVSTIPEDRSVGTAKRSRSNRSRGSKGSKRER